MLRLDININRFTNDIVKVSNGDGDRKSRIHQLCKSSKLSENERRELSDLTQEFGDCLSGPYVWGLLHQDNNEVTVYKRSSDTSCYSIFTIKIDDETKEIILHLKAICSASLKKKENANVTNNLLIDNFNKLKTGRTKSNGDYALFDLEYRLRIIMACNEFRGYTAKINLGAINKENVVSFYVRNGFNFESGTDQDSLIPMQKTLQNTKEWEEFLKVFQSIQERSRSQKMKLIYQFQKKIFMRKNLLYTGVNMSGQTYFVYTDGSFSYLNRDGLNRMSSIYHKERDGTVDFIRLNEMERQMPEKSSDEESGDDEMENEQQMEEEEDQTHKTNGY